MWLFRFVEARIQNSLGSSTYATYLAHGSAGKLNACYYDSQMAPQKAHRLLKRQGRSAGRNCSKRWKGISANLAN